MSYPPFFAFSANASAGQKKDFFGVADKVAYRGESRRAAEDIARGAAEQFRRAFVEVVVEWPNLVEWEKSETVVSETFLLSSGREVAQKLSDSVTKVLKVENLFLLLDREATEHKFVQVEIFPTSFGKEEQRRLNLSEYFAPSPGVVSIWTDSLRQLAIDAGRQEVDFTLAGASSEARAHEFAVMFRSTIGSFAQFTRFEGGDPRLVRSGKFTGNFQRALYQQFEIVPEKLNAFLVGLSRDFLDALVNGWRVEGEWGRLDLVASDEVILSLKPVVFVEDPDFVESEDVE